LSHLCAPDGVNSEILVENHEQIVEPSFAETLVTELCV
jgi:hypothetical protein